MLTQRSSYDNQEQTDSHTNASSNVGRCFSVGVGVSSLLSESNHFLCNINVKVKIVREEDRTLMRIGPQSWAVSPIT